MSSLYFVLLQICLQLAFFPTGDTQEPQDFSLKTRSTERAGGRQLQQNQNVRENEMELIRSNSPQNNDPMQGVDPNPVPAQDVSPDDDKSDPVSEATNGMTSTLSWLDGFQEPRTQKFIEDAERRVSLISEHVQKAYKRRTTYLADCKCVYNVCQNVVEPSATCGYDLGSYEVCNGCEGQLYTVDRGYTLVSTSSDPQNLNAAQKSSLCFLGTFDEIIEDLKALNTTSWTYIGLSTGVIWNYPGRSRPRSKEIGEEQWNFCEPFDHRVRSWYHEGSTGPLDIVILVDKSDSMNQMVNQSDRRWDVLQRAMQKFLDTFTYADFINVALFNDKGNVLDARQWLLQATRENVDNLKEQLLEEEPSGGTDFQRAFDQAFNMLIDGASAGTTSGCEKIILFLTDGRDNYEQENKAGRVQEILDGVEERQQELKEVTGKRAKIFSFSIGSTAGDQIPRQLACRNDGSWEPIRSEDDPLVVLGSYIKHIAAGRDNRRFYWTPPYMDLWGLGEMISIIVPVYTPDIDEHKGVQFGVAAHDIVIADVDAVVGGRKEEFFEALTNGSRTCDVFSKNRCQEQIYRGEGMQCPDLTQQLYTCSKFEDRYYFKGSLQSWQEAKESCELMNGQLVSVNTPSELGFLAGMSDPQGSWIGLTNRSQIWVWLDDEAEDIDDSPQFWGYDEPSNAWSIVSEDCASISPSGATQNIYSTYCEFELTYLCEFESLPTACTNEQLFDADDPNFVKSMPLIKECTFQESLYALSFFEDAEVDHLSSSDLFCEDDFNNSTFPVLEDLFCCDLNRCSINRGL